MERGRHAVAPDRSTVQGLPVLVAAPGHPDGGGGVRAVNLRMSRPLVEELDLQAPAALVLNDAAAAALGESVLRGAAPDLLYLGLGTGVGSAVVSDGRVADADLLGHRGRHGPAACTCGRTGCLETVAAGWALPASLTRTDVARVAAALAGAVRGVGRPPALVVVGGGLARRYPALVEEVAGALPGYLVEPSLAPSDVKSAAAWGLAAAFGAGFARARGTAPGTAPTSPQREERVQT